MKLSEEVISALDASTIIENSLVLPGKPGDGTLSPKLYREVNKALECLGGKWNRKARAHLFDESPADAISDAIAAGSVEDCKKALQFFETPPALAADLVRMADVQPRHLVLEPSSGRGAIVRAMRQEAPGATITSIEIDPKHKKHFAGMGGVLHQVADFTEEVARPYYDRIVANPPFAKQQDIAHVTHMLRFLKPGGFLISIMSDSVRWRTDSRSVEFRKMVDANIRRENIAAANAAKVKP